MVEDAATEDETPVEVADEAPKKRAPKKPADPEVTVELTMKASEWAVLRNRVGASGMPAIDRAQAAILEAIS